MSNCITSFSGSSPTHDLTLHPSELQRSTAALLYPTLLQRAGDQAQLLPLLLPLHAPECHLRLDKDSPNAALELLSDRSANTLCSR